MFLLLLFTAYLSVNGKTFSSLLTMLIQINGGFGWTLFGIVWGCALAGIILKLFFVKKFVILSTLFYILMGWMIVIAWQPLTEALHSNGVMLLVTGGIIYTIGSIFYV